MQNEPLLGKGLQSRRPCACPLTGSRGKGTGAAGRQARAPGLPSRSSLLAQRHPTRCSYARCPTLPARCCALCSPEP